MKINCYTHVNVRENVKSRNVGNVGGGLNRKNRKNTERYLASLTEPCRRDASLVVVPIEAATTEREPVEAELFDVVALFEMAAAVAANRQEEAFLLEPAFVLPAAAVRELP
jgi:hypothetical protein